MRFREPLERAPRCPCERGGGGGGGADVRTV